MGKDIPCAYGVLKKNDSYLLVKSKGSTKWNLPGGRKKSSETYEEALKRESFEELGCHFFISSDIYSKVFKTSKGKTKVKNFFVINPLINNNYSPNSEIRKIKYFSYDEIANLKDEKKLKKGVFKAIKNVRKNKLETILV